MTFLHTADWQMGMRAESVGKMAERVREERLAAAQRVVQAARDHNAEMLLLTGDVFEDNAVDRLLVRKVGEVLRRFPGPVYVISGNHDPLSPGSVWEHSVWKEAGNITVFTKNEPLELNTCVLFPCPLREKYSSKDPTAWINAHDATKPAIALAHGNVEGIPSGEPDYPIPRDAATRRGLDYLALGHWHSFARYDDPNGECRMAYSGTHETTKFGERDSGNTILVEISRRGAPPTLTSIRTGGLDWRTIEHSVAQLSSLESLVQQLTEIAQPGSTLIRMHLDGILFPEDRDALKRLDEILTSRFLFGALEATGLTPAPDGEGWIESLPAGTFRDAAQKLRALASQSSGTDQQAVASQALLQLFDLYERSRA
ncbi:MAG: DNA repair exonuclease [Verrucomicrobia bacterium]|nr:DNA repair exonuclease [Verrucomicrobiota bacterium]